jgi:hypothetical protein
MTQPILNSPCIVSGVGQCVAAAVPQHVCMHREVGAGTLADSLDKPIEDVILAKDLEPLVNWWAPRRGDGSLGDVGRCYAVAAAYPAAHIPKQHRIGEPDCPDYARPRARARAYCPCPLAAPTTSAAAAATVHMTIWFTIAASFGLQRGVAPFVAGGK